MTLPLVSPGRMEFTAGMPLPTVGPDGGVQGLTPANPWETGFKDMVASLPHQLVVVKAVFELPVCPLCPVPHVLYAVPLSPLHGAPWAV